jgi:PIN domain nuclease of toxin-antitoxin system
MTRILLDSHALFWFLDGDQRLSTTARQAIEDPDAVVHVSAVTAYEIVNKVRLGKWSRAAALAQHFSRIVSELDFEALPLTLEHAQHAARLTVSHRDPFDRMLAAQAEIEAIPLVTADDAFAQFNVRTLW